LFDALADPLFVLEVRQAGALQISAANAACESFFGAPHARYINRPLDGVLPPKIARRFAAECERCLAVGHPIEFRVALDAEGHRAFGVKLTLLPGGDEVRHIAALARLASTASGLAADPKAEHFRVIAEHAADYISRCDRNGRILYLNPAIERLTGADYLSLIGKDISEWPADLPHIQRYRECIRRVVETGKPQIVEMDLRDPASGQIVYHQVRYAPEWGPDGEVVSIIGVGRDITPLKAAEAELRKLNATLEERVLARTHDLERANADLRGFASTISHDLRAPLRAIRYYLAQLAENEGARLSDDGRALFGRVTAAATKLDGLINAVLAYSQAGQNVVRTERVAMAEIAREVTEELLQKPSSSRVDIARLPVASADPTMVRQIFQNLIGNAFKFSAGREQPQIEVGFLDQSGPVVYYVRDNGVGFDMQYANKLYSMFERLHTQDEFPGSGVGLAIVKRLVERHGGRIWAKSRIDEGATFYFTLAAGSSGLTSSASSLADAASCH
jgi:PAS domain S-box-containing protein